MARKDTIPVSIAGGLDGATHPYLQTKLEVMENCVYDKRGAVTKRNGTNIVTGAESVQDGTDLASSSLAGPMQKPRGMFSYEDVSVVIGQDQLYTRSYALDTTGGGKRIYKDYVPNCTATVRGVEYSTKNLISSDIARGQNYDVIVYVENDSGLGTSAGSIKYTVRDATNGTIIRAGTIDTTTGNGYISPKVVIIGTTAVVVYYRIIAGAATVYARTLSLSSINSGWSSATQLITNGGADSATYHPFDICTSGSNLVVAMENDSNNVLVRTYNTSLSQQATYTGADSAVTGAIAVTTSTDGSRIWVAYGNSTADTRMIALTTGLVLDTAAFTVRSVSAGTTSPYLLGLATTSATGVFVVASCGGTPVNTWGMFCSTSGAVGEVVALNGDYQMASRPWKQGERVVSVVQGGDRDSTKTDASLLIVDWNFQASTSATEWTPRPICNIAPRQAAVALSASTRYSLSSVVGSDNDRAFVSHAAANPSPIQPHISAVSLTFNEHVPVAVVGQCACIASGVPSFFDGKTVIELGSLEVAELASAAADAGAGSLSSGIYKYKLVREVHDNSGTVHYSAPSAAKTITGVSGQSAIVTYYNLGLTTAQDAENLYPITIVNALYRTLVNGDTYYRLTVLPTFTTGVYNSPTTTTVVSVTDTTSDATLATYPQLYTTGTIDGDGRTVSSSAILDNVCPPSAKYTIAHFGRFWLAGTPDDTIWYSKKVVPLEGPGFNEALTIDAFEGGRTTGIASDGERLLIFKQSGVWQVYGDGADDAGNGATLSAPKKLTDLGCTNSRSIVATPVGVFFQSPRGIFFISKGGIEVAFVGEDVRDKTDGQTIVTATFHPNTNRVHFSRSSDELVYDIDRRSWSVFKYFVDDSASNMYAGPLVACVNDGVYEMVMPIATDNYYYELVEDSTHYTDSYASSAGTFVPMTIETGWLRLGEVQGYQRVSRVQVLGEKHTAHAMTMTEYTDYKTASNNTETRQSSAISSGRPEQFEFGVLVQRCQALKVKLTDSEFGTVGTGKGCTIASLVLLGNVNRGKWRPAPSVAR